MRARPYDAVKRVIDLVVASVLLVATVPVQAVIAVLVRRKLGSPVLFRQPRPGKDERVFELVKFRTMLAPDPARGLVSDDQRLTEFGRLLRSTSLDELPTLWNVVKGDMSLVGPRPLLVQYLDRYSDEQRRRHEVRPGVTGLAQVSGRNALTWEAKFAKDVEYVDGRSLGLDLRILLATLSGVLRREGIAADGAATMPEFLGSTLVSGQGLTSREPAAPLGKRDAAFVDSSMLDEDRGEHSWDGRCPRTSGSTESSPGTKQEAPRHRDGD